MSRTDPDYAHPMVCSWCQSELGYVHGHAACLNGTCPMFGLNQAECCDGDTAATCTAPTATVARRPVPAG